jgi:hypothetical protein
MERHRDQISVGVASPGCERPVGELDRALEIPGEPGDVRLHHRDQAVLGTLGYRLGVPLRAHQESGAHGRLVSLEVLHGEPRGGRRRAEIITLGRVGRVRALPPLQ